MHIENTVQFVQKLIEAGIPYDLQIYPRKTHSIAGPDVRTHLYNRILAQFEEYLKPKESLDQKPVAPAGNWTIERVLYFVAMEDLVLFAFGAAGALHAADEEHGHAYRDQHGQDDSILHKPMRQSLHFRSPIRGRRTLLSMR